MLRHKHLHNYEVLVISTALGAEKMNDPKAASPAFTPDEWDILQQWVRTGGSPFVDC
jgi:hypothetical protein